MKQDHLAHGSPLSGVDLSAQAKRDRRKGAPFHVQNSDQSHERCIVKEVYPGKYTCDVFTERGKFLSGVPWPGGEEDIRAPRRGDQLGVHFHLGSPTLFEARVDTLRDREGEEAFRLTGAPGFGADDPIYAQEGDTNQRGDAPRDVLPGDWVRQGELGQMLGVLTGGTTIFKAGELAQIIATQARNLLRLVGQNFQLYTGAGELQFTTEDGKTSMILRAGGDVETESSPSQDNFRIRCELGDEGEMVDFRVTDGKGRELYRIHIDPDGRVQKQALRETSIFEEDRRTEIGTNDATVIGGARATNIGGTDNLSSGGAREVEVGGAHRTRAAGDIAQSTLRDYVVNSRRNVDMRAFGDPVGGLTTPAFSVTVANGNVEFDVGNPISGSILPTSKFKVNTLAGDIDFTALAAYINLNSSLPGGVKAGGPGPGLFNAVLFETLKAFFEVFGTLLDTHIHGQPALGGIPTTPPLVPPWTSSKALLELAKSNFVKIGG
jgi:hypothetical protein